MDLGLDRDAFMQQPLGWREEYAMDGSPVHRRTHTHLSVTPRGCLECEDSSRTLEYPKKPTSARGRMTSSKMAPEPPTPPLMEKEWHQLGTAGCSIGGICSGCVFVEASRESSIPDGWSASGKNQPPDCRGERVWVVGELHDGPATSEHHVRSC